MVMRRDLSGTLDRGGGQHVSGSGRFVLCLGSSLTFDGLICVQDGMAVDPKVDPFNASEEERDRLTR